MSGQGEDEIKFPLACVGLHLPLAQPQNSSAQADCARLRWMSETSRTTYARVVQHTCDDCVSVSYELCAAGGLMFIRRTDRTRGGKREVRETERLISSRAREMWRDLLLGLVPELPCRSLVGRDRRGWAASFG